MFDNVFADPVTLMQGALAGLIFGFLLQKGGVTRYKTIVGQFLFTDFTVLKVMLSAIIVGAVGIFAMRLANPDLPMHVKNAALLGNAVGGLIFGVGMAMLGFCPGTGVAAIGDGSRHAIPGVLGMLVGAAAYAEVYPWLKSRLLGVGDIGKATFDSVSGLSPWWFIIGILGVSVVVFVLIESHERSDRRASPTTT